MVSYESIFIINSKIGEEAIKEMVEKFKGIFEKSTKLGKIDEWGKRKLAYPIEKIEEGYYVLVNFEAEPSFPSELERLYKITESIIKYLVIKK
ncbi:MAG: 30S ribosomal protein S6 [Clostridiales bacterium]